MERDLLTSEEVSALIFAQGDTSVAGWKAIIQAAARLGAERERERAARIADAAGSNHDHATEMTARYIAAAIRRGEGDE